MIAVDESKAILAYFKAGGGGTFEHFKSYGYLENFRKTTTTVILENYKPFASNRVQFSCTICLGVVWLLFILMYKY
jgi:hypothetical protein